MRSLTRCQYMVNDIQGFADPDALPCLPRTRRVARRWPRRQIWSDRVPSRTWTIHEAAPMNGLTDKTIRPRCSVVGRRQTHAGRPRTFHRLEVPRLRSPAARPDQPQSFLKTIAGTSTGRFFRCRSPPPRWQSRGAHVIRQPTMWPRRGTQLVGLSSPAIGSTETAQRHRRREPTRRPFGRPGATSTLDC